MHSLWQFNLFNVQEQMDKMFMCHINGNVASFSQGVQIIFKFNLLSNCDDTKLSFILYLRFKIKGITKITRNYEMQICDQRQNPFNSKVLILKNEAKYWGNCINEKCIHYFLCLLNEVLIQISTLVLGTRYWN